jgi:predicted PhzF superfamily epimerase YddE/YHI9
MPTKQDTYEVWWYFGHREGKVFIFEQGDFIGRKGRVSVTYSPMKNKLAIAGKAFTVLKGELNF